MESENNGINQENNVEKPMDMEAPFRLGQESMKDARTQFENAVLAAEKQMAESISGTREVIEKAREMFSSSTDATRGGPVQDAATGGKRVEENAQNDSLNGSVAGEMQAYADIAQKAVMDAVSGINSETQTDTSFNEEVEMGGGKNEGIDAIVQAVETVRESVSNTFKTSASCGDIAQKAVENAVSNINDGLMFTENVNGSVDGESATPDPVMEAEKKVSESLVQSTLGGSSAGKAGPANLLNTVAGNFDPNVSAQPNPFQQGQ